MDALTFLLDSLAIVLLVFWGLKDDRQSSSATMRSLFRYRETATEAPERRSRYGAATRPPVPPRQRF